MDIEFITLCKLGVGPIVVRYADIITMEYTPLGFTRIEFGYGEHLIVEQTPVQVLALIRNAQYINEQLNKPEDTKKE